MWCRIRAAVGVLCMLSTAGCNVIAEQRYYREGIGSDLTWSGQAEATVLQDQYLELLCRQAAPKTGMSEQCAAMIFGSNLWPLIVQAGMNDIDQRCDAFLNWVDYHRRNDRHLIKQLSDTVVATTQILSAVNASAKAMDIVAAALGFASNTFANMTGRLLTIADGTTVQSVVLSGQNRFRIAIRDQHIDNRPAAIHALRSYLRICMPFTIETRINSTVTIYEQSGVGALSDYMRVPLINANTIGPIKARDTIRIVDREPRKPIPEAARFITNYNPESHGPRGIKRVLNALCFRGDKVEESDISSVARLIRIYQQRFHQNEPNYQASGILDGDREFSFLVGLPPCPVPFKNYYERIWEGYESNANKLKDLRTFVAQLNAIPAGGSISPSATFTSDAAALRNKIRAVNQHFKLPATDEVTAELRDKLQE